MMIQTKIAKKILEDLNPWHFSSYQRPNIAANRVALRALRSFGCRDSSILIINGFLRQGKTYTLKSIVSILLESVESAHQVLLLDLDSAILRSANLSLTLNAWKKDRNNQNLTIYLIIDNAHLIGEKIVFCIKMLMTGFQHVKILAAGLPKGKWKYLLQGLGDDLNFKISEDLIDNYTFFDYIKYYSVDTSAFSSIENFRNLFNFSQNEFDNLIASGRELEAHFKKYLCMGAHPAALKFDTVFQAQEWIRTQFINEVLETGIVPSQKNFDPNEVVRVFFELATKEHPLIELDEICESLGLSKPLFSRYLKELVDTGLMSKVSPIEYKSGFNRGLHMFLMRSPELLCALRQEGEEIQFRESYIHPLILSAVHLHLVSRNGENPDTVAHGHKKNKPGSEFIVKMRGVKNSTPEEKNIVFDVKLSNRNLVNADLRHIEYACTKAGHEQGYVITQSFNDFGWSEIESDKRLKPGKKEIKKIKVLRIPAALLCYFLGKQAQNDNRQLPTTQPSTRGDWKQDLPFTAFSHSAKD